MAANSGRYPKRQGIIGGQSVNPFNVDNNPFFTTAKGSTEARALASKIVAVLEKAGLDVKSLGSIGITLNTDEKGWKFLTLHSCPAKDPAEELLDGLLSHAG